MPTPLEDYLFDLQGYLLIRGALPPAEIAELNRIVDAVPPLKPREWHGRVHRNDYTEAWGVNLHQVIEAGEPFERLIDHPAWLAHVTRYVGGDDGLFIDENLVTTRGPGQGVTLHSGGHKRRIRTQFRYHDGQFRCGQINVLLALTDAGPGDGATMVIPGSHKSNLPHPAFVAQSKGEYAATYGTTVDRVEGAIEVHAKAGDALLFVDCVAHGSAQRTNPGFRRHVIYRYGPHWGHSRYGYEPSPELLARLTPERRKIIQPLPPLMPAT
jgi:hypothetical protein